VIQARFSLPIGINRKTKIHPIDTLTAMHQAKPKPIFHNCRAMCLEDAYKSSALTVIA
jgi:hypothetical protein